MKSENDLKIFFKESRFQKRKVGIMSSKQVMLLTSENLDRKEPKKIYKKGSRVKAVFMTLVMALLISCVSLDNTAVCNAKETVKVSSEKKSSKDTKKKNSKKTKKNSRKKASAKKNAKKVSKKSRKKSASKKAKNTKKKSSKKGKAARKKKSSKERYTVYGTPSHNSFKSYMSYRAVSSSSAQGKLQAKAKTDAKTGIRKVDGRYCVALGSYYCSKIGTKFDLVMSNGSVVKCILGDQKANRDTDAKNQKTSDGSIAEFLVDMNKLPSKVKTMGDVSYADKDLKGNIAKIRVYEK